MIPLTNYQELEIITIILTFVLSAFYFTNVYQFKKRSSAATSQLYTYSGQNGPLHWKEKFKESNGSLQSPINISQYTVIVPAETDPVLCFSEEYNITPKEMSVYNDGYSVSIYSRWESGIRPQLTGGPCAESFEFLNGRFRWGPNDEEGSEHTIECKAFAMEFQALHVKSGKNYTTLTQAAEDNGLLIISYFYDITPVVNPYLQPLIATLKKIENPHVCTYMEPIPLFFLMPSFVCKYVNYVGSLTYPPCTEGVQWIIQTEPLGIAASQVAEFRRLCSFSDNLTLNRRPVQNVNGRDIMFYD